MSAIDGAGRTTAPATPTTARVEGDPMATTTPTAAIATPQPIFLGPSLPRQST